MHLQFLGPHFISLPYRGSHIVANILCILLATLTLGLVSPACGSTLLVKGDTPRHQMILADFDGDRHAGMAWHAPPGLVGSLAQLALVSAPEQVVHGKALHLQYWFPEAARALAHAGLHSQEAEVRVRLSLPDVDASAYDALVFWIKGDATHGFAAMLEVGFLRPHPALPGHSKRVAFGSRASPTAGSRW